MTAPASPCTRVRARVSPAATKLGVPLRGEATGVLLGCSELGDRTGVTAPAVPPPPRRCSSLPAVAAALWAPTHAGPGTRPSQAPISPMPGVHLRRPWRGARGNNESSQLLPRPGGGTHSCPCRTRGAAPPGYALRVLGPLLPQPGLGVEGGRCPLFALAPPALPEKFQGRALGGFVSPPRLFSGLSKQHKWHLGSWSGPRLPRPHGIL